MNTSTNRENATLKPVKKIYKIKKDITRTEFWTYIRCLSVCFASSGSILWNAVEAVPKEEEKP
jgi:hypothetical protein